MFIKQSQFFLMHASELQPAKASCDLHAWFKILVDMTHISANISVLDPYQYDTMKKYRP